VRVLGVPNVADRIAQTAAAMLLEEKLEPIFHPDSYGYRPGRSAHDALAAARKRCWNQDWIVDLDIRAFFDSVAHDLLLKAVAHHTDERWILLYIERWLKAPMQMPDGTVVAREKGTPQGSPISPLLANLFMHYAFDQWMVREHPGCPFERYADDIVVHCDTEGQARDLRTAIAERLGALGLELHPDKTKIVYCKDAKRRKDSEHTSFDFLGYTFRARRASGRHGRFVSFLPAMSTTAKKAKGRQIRAWHLNRRSGTDLSGLAEGINPQVRGWINYYGAFYRSELYSLAMRINEHLVRWAMQKFKRLRNQPTKAWAWLDAVRHDSTNLACSPTGTCFRASATDLWGPDEARVSRPVLREPRGATPLGYLPEPHARFDGGELDKEPLWQPMMAALGKPSDLSPAPPTAVTSPAPYPTNLG
ncbi:MAG: group II intron reverse transcriptase/maturase, partial [Actinomycetota bacterium]|nr:group II intron reverse transcriptase/maturase [Actinomycetota bacterium]